MRLTPERGSVIWLDAFRRWRGGLSFETRLLSRRTQPSLMFMDEPEDRWSDSELAVPHRDRIDVVVAVDGVDHRASDGGVGREDSSWSASGAAAAGWYVMLPDEVSDVRIRMECDSLPLHRIIELDCDMLRSALDEVWEL